MTSQILLVFEISRFFDFLKIFLTIFFFEKLGKKKIIHIILQRPGSIVKFGTNSIVN